MLWYSDTCEDDVEGWINCDDAGYEHLSDEQIVEHVSNYQENDSGSDMEDDKAVANEYPISNTDAADMFGKCLLWLRHQPEASVYNTSVLKGLAAKK